MPTIPSVRSISYATWIHDALMRCQNWLITQSRKRRLWMSFAAGVLLTLTMPPFFVFPLLVPSLMALYWLIVHADSRKQAFMLGWLYGLGFFMTGTYWIAISMTVDLARFGWMIPFSIFGLSSFLALYSGLLAYLLRAFALRGVLGVLTFALLWVAAEWLRGHVFTGFPWNPLANTWTFHAAAIQTASLWGASGLSFFTVLLCTLPASITHERKYGMQASIFGLLVLVAAMGWGIWRIHDDPGVVPDVKLRIVQASIPQKMKWDAAQQSSILRTYMEMTNRPGIDSITHILWPETAVPYVIDEQSEFFSGLRDHLPAGTTLLTGAMRSEGDRRNWKVWNSLYVISRQAAQTGIYDKMHLVPFGEFIPLRGILPVESISGGLMDISTGTNRRALDVPSAPAVKPLICYEGIFPELGFTEGKRPGWLLNATNDAWFGNSIGPYQHLHLVQLRAVEQGLPLIRAANTGISAVIDAYGTIVNSLPLNHTGILDSPLPNALTPTWFGRFGSLPFLLLLYAIFLLAFLNQKSNE